MPLTTLKNLASHLEPLRRTQLWAQILIGMVLGIGVGLLLGPTTGLVAPETAAVVGNWLALPGRIFLALIQAVVIPLVASSIVLGLNSSDDIRAVRDIGFRVVPFFVITTVAACLIGLALAVAIEPGAYVDSSLVERVVASDPAAQPAATPSGERLSMPERIVALIPESFQVAALNRNMLQIVVFSILIGIALLTLPRERSRPLLGILDSLQAVSMKVVSWAMLLAPYAVFGLLAQITTQIGIDAILGMSVYVGVVVLGLLAMLVTYLLILAILGRTNPLQFLGQVREVMLLAFSTSSSAAVMPLSIKIAEERLSIRPAISQFVIPLGATINMAGTALYQVVAAVFLTQVFDVSLTPANMALLITTTVGASIGSPASPGVGIVILATILSGIGVPTGGIALIIGVDRILDMCRTSVNVVGDLTACQLVERWLAKPTPAATSSGN